MIPFLSIQKEMMEIDDDIEHLNRGNEGDEGMEGWRGNGIPSRSGNNLQEGSNPSGLHPNPTHDVVSKSRITSTSSSLSKQLED